MSEQHESEQLRARIRGMGKRGRGRRYPADVCEQVVSHVTARRAQGVTLRTAAQELGMPWRTVGHWIQGRSRARRTGPLRAVTITAPVVGRTVVVVHGPGGLRIEGLGVEQIAELLLRLA